MKTQRSEEDWMEYYRNLKGRANPGFLNELDPEVVSVDIEKQTMTVTFLSKEYMRNPARNLHGGVIAAMADSAMGILAIILHEGTYGATADLNINYIRPIPMNKKILLNSKCWKSGRTLTFMTCEGYAEDKPDEVLFTASSRYVLVPDVHLDGLKDE